MDMNKEMCNAYLSTLQKIKKYAAHINNPLKGGLCGHDVSPSLFWLTNVLEIKTVNCTQKLCSL